MAPVGLREERTKPSGAFGRAGQSATLLLVRLLVLRGLAMLSTEAQCRSSIQKLSREAVVSASNAVP
jgi:hypothetical protein